MNKAAWDRWAPFSGIVFVALIVVTFFLPAKTPPDAGDTAEAWTSFVQGHRTALLISAYLTGLALVFFLFFLGSLVSRLRAAGEQRLAAVAMGGGLVTAGLWLAWMSFEASITWGFATDLDPGDVKTLLGTVDFGFGFPLAVLVGAASVAALRSRLWPARFSLLGAVGALWLVVGGAALARDGFFSPQGGYRLVGFLIFFVWILVASAYMLLSAPAAEARAPAAS